MSIARLFYFERYNGLAIPMPPKEGSELAVIRPYGRRKKIIAAVTVVVSNVCSINICNVGGVREGPI